MKSLAWGQLYVYCLKLDYTNCISHKTCVLRVLSTALTYSRIPGDQGEPFLLDLRFFSAVVLHTNWYTTICILDTNSFPNVSKFTN
jgi:hypothetical protein